MAPTHFIPNWVRRFGAMLSVLMLVLPAVGCASPRHGDLVAFLRSYEEEISSGEYRVAPPDALRIHAATAPEIDGAEQQIRSDGKIALRLVGEVQVAGMTPEEVGGKLQDILERYYVDPQIVVEVSQYKSKSFYVLGQVQKVGPMPYTGRDTLLNAIAKAKPNDIADWTQVKVIRPAPGDEGRHVVIVNLKDMVEKGETENNFLLQEDDIVFVPPTALGWLGLRIREVLFPLSPLIQAYTLPASVVFANEVYRGDTDN